MRLTEAVRNLWESLRLLRRASPRAFVTAMSANVLVGILPAALLYVNAQLVARLTTDTAAAIVAVFVVIYFLLSGFQDGLTAMSSFVADALQDAVRMMIRRDVNHAVATFPDLSVHEDSEIRETALLAADASDKISELASHLYAVFAGTVMLVPILVIIGGISWWIPFFLLFGMAPVVWIRARSERESWDVKEHHGATFNELRILDRVLTQPDFAKDLRIFRMQPQIIERWTRIYENYLEEIKRVRVRNVIGLIIVSLFASVCVAVPLYVVVRGFRHGLYDTVQLVFFLGALFQLKDGLAAIIYNFGDLLSVSYAVRPLRKLLDLRASHGASQPEYREMVETSVELCDVGLTYRDTDRCALDRINLRLRRGEMVAVAGDNGAGKTSLLKVLSGFCEPTVGKVVWSSATWRPSGLVGVFQDFARFPLSARANLASNDERKIRQCLDAVGLGFLSDDLDVPLTVEVEGGIDISGGQWQRLAIARAMVHADDADLLLFDEPTSALDPESEGEIMQLILKMSKGHTTVIVSHRLAMTQFVDRIIVLDAGRIIEEGSHDALVERQGKYARMFECQAMFYRASESPRLRDVFRQ